MKYKYLNEVLLNWNSDKDLQDNNIIKSSDIKKKISGCFIYKIENKPSRIKIFDITAWPKYRTYKDKVYINGKHVELKSGETVDKFAPGEYMVYIEDIDQVKNTECMFYKCHQLVKAYIPNTFTRIGDQAFQNCSGLTSVTIPNSVTSIGENAFFGCRDLVSITIPNSITSISYRAFQYCYNLQTVYVEDINKFKQIKFPFGKYSKPTCYGAKLIELKK